GKGALATLEVAAPRVDPRVADPNAAPSRESTVALPWVSGETVRGAILKAGGLAPWADLGNAWIEHAGGEEEADGAAQQQGVAMQQANGASSPSIAIATQQSSAALQQQNGAAQQSAV